MLKKPELLLIRKNIFEFLKKKIQYGKLIREVL